MPWLNIHFKFGILVLKYILPKYLGFTTYTWEDTTRSPSTQFSKQASSHSYPHLELHIFAQSAFENFQTTYIVQNVFFVGDLQEIYYFKWGKLSFLYQFSFPDSLCITYNIYKTHSQGWNHSYPSAMNHMCWF